MTTMIRRTLAATCVALGLMATAPMPLFAAEKTTVLSVATKAPELSTFVRLVQQAGLTSALEGADVTVFAPTDTAFKAVPAATLDKLAKDPELLKSVLTYHVLPGKVMAGSIETNAAVTTLQGAKVNVSRAGDFVTVDEGMVIQADMPAGNGIVHVIDRVLMPAIKK